MVLLRHLLGDALRRLRLRQGRTLREVSAAARVSLEHIVSGHLPDRVAKLAEDPRAWV